MASLIPSSIIDRPRYEINRIHKKYHERKKWGCLNKLSTFLEYVMVSLSPSAKDILLQMT